MRPASAAILALLLATACQFDVASSPSEFTSEDDDDGDAAPGLPDAAPGLPDAAPGLPDAAPGLPDAAPGLPDAGPGLPDAGPGLPDAAPPEPDAAPPPEPDAAPPPEPDAAPPPEPDAGPTLVPYGSACAVNADCETAVCSNVRGRRLCTLVCLNNDDCPDGDDCAGFGRCVPGSGAAGE